MSRRAELQRQADQLEQQQDRLIAGQAAAAQTAQISQIRNRVAMRDAWLASVFGGRRRNDPLATSGGGGGGVTAPVVTPAVPLPSPGGGGGGGSQGQQGGLLSRIRTGNGIFDALLRQQIGRGLFGARVRR